MPPEAAAAPAPEAELETEVNKSAREKVLDHLTDSEGPQTVAEIIQGTGLIRNTAEQAIFRAVQSEQLQRVSQGVYRLAPPKPPEPPKPAPTPEPPKVHEDGLAERRRDAEAAAAKQAAVDAELRTKLVHQVRPSPSAQQQLMPDLQG